MRPTIQEIIKRTDHIPSYTLRGEMELWYELLTDLPEEAIILDFGTGWGKSAAALALCAPQAQVVTFDTGEEMITNGHAKDYSEYFTKVEAYHKGIPNIRQFVSSCQDMGVHAGFDIARFLIKERRQYFDVWNLDCAWTDKHHTLKEISIFFPYLRKGGLLFVHDYTHWQSNAVRKAIDEALRDRGLVEQLAYANLGKYGCAAFRKL